MFIRTLWCPVRTCCVARVTYLGRELVAGVMMICVVRLRLLFWEAVTPCVVVFAAPRVRVVGFNDLTALTRDCAPRRTQCRGNLRIPWRVEVQGCRPSCSGHVPS